MGVLNWTKIKWFELKFVVFLSTYWGISRCAKFMLVYESYDSTSGKTKDSLKNKLPIGFLVFVDLNYTMDWKEPSNDFPNQYIVHNSVLFCHKRGEMGWILSWHSACEVSRRSQLLFLGLGKRFGDKTATLKSTTQFLQTRQTTSLTPNSRSSS